MHVTSFLPGCCIDSFAYAGTIACWSLSCVGFERASGTCRSFTVLSKKARAKHYRDLVVVTNAVQLLALLQEVSLYTTEGM